MLTTIYVGLKYKNDNIRNFTTDQIKKERITTKQLARSEKRFG